MHLRVELVKLERTVVLRARKPEPEVHELGLPRLVAVVHRPNLRNRHVALVYYREEVVRKVVQQALWRGTRRTARERTRIVLDAVAVSELPHHLHVVLRALLEALRLQKLPLRRKELQSLVQFGLYPRESRLELVLAHHELLSGRHDSGGHRDSALAGQRVKLADGIHLVAEELDAYRLGFVGGEDVDYVAPHAERPRGEVVVVADVLRLDETREKRGPAARLLSRLYTHRQIAVFVRLAQSVYAAHRRDDYNVPPAD